VSWESKQQVVCVTKSLEYRYEGGRTSLMSFYKCKVDYFIACLCRRKLMCLRAGKRMYRRVKCISWGDIQVCSS